MPVPNDWYKDAVFYEVPIRSFCDGNGDGFGDFAGLTSRLEYIADLGVTTIWVLPFYPSPLRDDGYDIADYRTVDPRFGDMEAFRRFVDEAHRRGLKVVTELVINHTSIDHEWFQRARRAPEGSSERDFYVWSDSADRFSEARVIFTFSEDSNWAWDEVAGAYYWHRFFSHQPDLNYDSPAVREAVFEILDHWLEMGVDGLRLDAVPYLYVREGTNGENLPETHAFLKRLRAHVDRHFPGTMLLAEANQWPEDAAAYFGAGDESHINYHFPLMPRLYMAIAQGDRTAIREILARTPEIPDAAQWGIFVRNHDELTLEMVTEEEREFMLSTYAADPRAPLNVGIRRRLAPLMGNDSRKIRLMLSLLFSLPGSPFLYYGDEIGMGDDLDLQDRDGVRTPMQWDDSINAGFSTAAAEDLYSPVISDPEFGYRSVNVAAQQSDPDSLADPADRAVLAFHLRTTDETVFVAANFADRVAAIDAPIGVDVFSGERVGGPRSLEPYGFVWISEESPGRTPAGDPTTADRR
jgi:maltose alpha-D-glucosyltransferase/alpha-amylase